MGGHFARPCTLRSKALMDGLPLLLEDVLLPAQASLPVIQIGVPPGYLGTDEFGLLSSKDALCFFPLACQDGVLIANALKIGLVMSAALLLLRPLGHNGLSMGRCPPPGCGPPAALLFGLDEGLQRSELGIQHSLILFADFYPVPELGQACLELDSSLFISAG